MQRAGTASRARSVLGPGGATILILGVTSFLTDVSSEMTLTVLPIFLTGTLGVSVATVGIIEEAVCPSCLKPIDPTLNACTNSSCRLGGVVRNVAAFEGPCWRCAGQGICPECQGSGAGTLAVYGSTPSDCWACGQAGRCQECDGTGFTAYHGGLPPKFAQHRTSQGSTTYLESKQRNWQHPADDAPAESDEGSSE